MSDQVQEQLEAIGAQLRVARIKAYLTQSDVGQLAGVSRQLVSRVEQGCNGEVSAYVAVAAALNHRLTLEEGAATSGNGMPALDFGSEQTSDDAGQRSPGGRKTTKGSRATK